MNKRQSGAALITALLIMSLVAIAATMMSIRLQADIDQAQLLFNSQKLYLAAQGTEYWAKGKLIANASHINRKKARDELLDIMPQTFPSINYKNIQVSGLITDQQGKFNINNLTNPRAISQFVTLLKAVDQNIGNTEATNISNAVSDWVQTSGIPSSRGSTYLNQIPPYRAAHRPMSSISELLLVKGITSKIYQELKPYICALPETTPINVNTADAPVLMTLGPIGGITKELANKIITLRKDLGGFKTIQQFNEKSKLKGITRQKNQVTVTSSYFLSQANARLGKQHMLLYTLLKRTIRNNKAAVLIMWESQNSL